MPDQRRPGAVLRFDNSSFAPGTAVIKAHERQRWVDLEQMRREADMRIEREVVSCMDTAREELERRGDELLAQRAGKLAETFANAAANLERAALDLAFEIASRVIDVSDPQAFFARAAEHLQALVPRESALCIRVNPKATGDLGAFSERLLDFGVRHISVVADPTLTDRRSLVVETSEGEIDLGCGTQLRHIVAEVIRAQAALADASGREHEGVKP